MVSIVNKPRAYVQEQRKIKRILGCIPKTKY